MHGPDGTDYDNAEQFLEVTPPARVVMEHEGPIHHFIMALSFNEEAGGARFTWRMRFDTAAQTEQWRAFIQGKNEENFDRLAAYLAKVDEPPLALAT